MLNKILDWFSPKPTASSDNVEPAVETFVVEVNSLPAYVNCGGGVEFSADFIVGMNLKELIECLQQNFCFQTIGFRGLCDELRLCKVNDLPVEYEYIIQPGDSINLDLQKKLSSSNEGYKKLK